MKKNEEFPELELISERLKEIRKQKNDCIEFAHLS